MSDRYYAHIEIGGILHPDMLEEFIELIESNDPSEFCKSNLEQQDTNSCGPLLNSPLESEIKRINGKYTLAFEDSSARYGEFEEIEDWCRKNKLAYRRQSSGYYDSLPCTEWYDPIYTDHAHNITCSNGGEALVYLSILKKAVSEGTITEIIEINDRVTNTPLPALWITDGSKGDEFLLVPDSPSGALPA